MNGPAVPREVMLDAYGFLSSILAGIAQPVWMVDSDGDIRFANPTVLAALGYDDAAELHGKPSHQMIHYKYPDGSPYPVADCPMLRPRQTGETIHSDEDWFVRRDGTMFPVEYWSAPIQTSAGRGAVVAFTDIEQRRHLERITRERDFAEARAAEAAAAQRRIIGERRRCRRSRHPPGWHAGRTHRPHSRARRHTRSHQSAVQRDNAQSLPSATMTTAHKAIYGGGHGAR